MTEPQIQLHKLNCDCQECASIRRLRLEAFREQNIKNAARNLKEMAVPYSDYRKIKTKFGIDK